MLTNAGFIEQMAIALILGLPLMLGTKFLIDTFKEFIKVWTTDSEIKTLSIIQFFLVVITNRAYKDKIEPIRKKGNRVFGTLFVFMVIITFIKPLYNVLRFQLEKYGLDKKVLFTNEDMERISKFQSDLFNITERDSVDLDSDTNTVE